MIKKLPGFTLIELLVSTTIILLLILLTVPNFDRARSKNLLETSNQKIQGCFMRAKALALSPEREVKDLEYYGVTIFSEKDPNNPNKCLIERKIKDPAPPAPPALLETVETISIPPEVAINALPAGAASNSSHAFKFSPELKGGFEDVLGSLNNIIIKDDNNKCLELYFAKTVGEITFGNIGIMVQGQCQ